MQQEINYRKENKNELIYRNPKIRICIICGDDKIESHEFGVSCEDCGALFWREKC